MFFKQDKPPIDTFVDSLNYWQANNLFIVLRMCLTSDDYDDAELKALTDTTDGKELKRLLEQAINSPRFPYNVKIDINVNKKDLSNQFNGKGTADAQ